MGAGESVPLDPRTLLGAYSQGLFPMADDCGIVQWYSADPRGIIPLEPEQFHVSRRLLRLFRNLVGHNLAIRFNSDFELTMCACREIVRQPAQGVPGSGGTGSWINEEIVEAYVRLHRLGFAHSVEVWEGDALVGGLYGVQLGAAFFGESMFHRRRDASKLALVALVERLRERGFELLDTQAVTAHLSRFGAREIPAEIYQERLGAAITKRCEFP